jgi:S1-C subfamily serine protease
MIGANVTPEIAEWLTATVASRLAVDSRLREGDIIHAFNRAPINNMDDLRAAFAKLKPGDPAALQVERGGKLTFLTLEME